MQHYMFSFIYQLVSHPKEGKDCTSMAWVVAEGILGKVGNQDIAVAVEGNLVLVVADRNLWQEKLMLCGSQKVTTFLQVHFVQFFSWQQTKTSWPVGQKKRSADKFDSSDPSYCQFLIKL